LDAEPTRLRTDFRTCFSWFVAQALKNPGDTFGKFSLLFQYFLGCLDKLYGSGAA
jgi:hypothetical protein